MTYWAGIILLSFGGSVFAALMTGIAASDREPSYDDHLLRQLAIVLSLAVMGLGAAMLIWG